MTGLYSFAPFDRSFRVRWLLKELDLPFDEQVLDFQAGEQRQGPYLALNPFGKVPALALDDEALFESGAIMMRLLERFDTEGRLQVRPDQDGRDQYLSLYFHLCATLDPLVVSELVVGRKARSQEEIATKLEVIKAQLAALRPRLAAGSYLMGERFTVLDILLGHMLGMLVGLGWVDEPLFLDYLARLAERPASQLKALDGLQ
ncbi:glutathione S-transferase family protein [Gallaecimonas sp. GXIMD4217]|uniref:glutathione S-transferase family protein n=1 Tax=Gallaecimonas sp. GXIMD4217 TaxID=3131927 RepID=UPI00311AD5C9